MPAKHQNDFFSKHRHDKHTQLGQPEISFFFLSLGGGPGTVYWTNSQLDIFVLNSRCFYDNTGQGCLTLFNVLRAYAKFDCTFVLHQHDSSNVTLPHPMHIKLSNFNTRLFYGRRSNMSCTNRGMELSFLHIDCWRQTATLRALRETYALFDCKARWPRGYITNVPFHWVGCLISFCAIILYCERVRGAHRRTRGRGGNSSGGKGAMIWCLSRPREAVESALKEDTPVGNAVRHGWLG